MKATKVVKRKTKIKHIKIDSAISEFLWQW